VGYVVLITFAMPTQHLFPPFARKANKGVMLVQEPMEEHGAALQEQNVPLSGNANNYHQLGIYPFVW
jgi:hypothetical protein